LCWNQAVKKNLQHADELAEMKSVWRKLNGKN
jgi:hypothetical protein